MTPFAQLEDALKSITDLIEVAAFYERKLQKTDDQVTRWKLNANRVDGLITYLK